MTTSPVLYLDTEPSVDSSPVLGLLGTTEYAGQRVKLPANCMQVLALLAVRAGTQTTVADIALELWGHREPRSARQTVQTYILQLRKRLSRDLIVTMPVGYTLAISRLAVDVHRFDHLVGMAKRELAAGDLKAAEDTLLAALSLWRGGALQDVRVGPVLSGTAAGIEDRRKTALAMRFDIDLRLGRHRDVVDELAEHSRADPGREDWTALLMLALYRSRRAAESLQAFTRLRHALAEGHGIDPCPELRLLQQQILRGDPALELNGETR